MTGRSNIIISFDQTKILFAFLAVLLIQHKQNQTERQYVKMIFKRKTKKTDLVFWAQQTLQSKYFLQESDKLLILGYTISVLAKIQVTIIKFRIYTFLQYICRNINNKNVSEKKWSPIWDFLRKKTNDIVLLNVITKQFWLCFQEHADAFSQTNSSYSMMDLLISNCNLRLLPYFHLLHNNTSIF